ncbi:polypeptide N-acetylgalactosaminyltransferase 5-like isoform X1 [Dinothrombium tinctorium]|uniref:Polypeptide N-acetylgalactosaminyltransferase n=1 Tax=Dinothrombium tinctorium TaxID=1965070 RepID=A0A443R826_9ACAR|nr:polypeptide N-acetylgalactosaminyltransferase 5-like isoform X1 [Dinothrombium tinctorium]RWS11428.1 polypeptide N-acetylgalactosaminyltransferase 5-like isoform X1 [Dinothrombium tinctorium]
MKKTDEKSTPFLPSIAKLIVTLTFILVPLFISVLLENYLFHEEDIFSDLNYNNASLFPPYNENSLRFWKPRGLYLILSCKVQLSHFSEPPSFIPNRAGERGTGVRVKSKKKKVERLFKLHSFNLLASDKIALNRTINDTRFHGCLAKKYPRKLPTASVIIVFHNEAFSTLMRTVQSVIQTSPKELLREVILVDDKSTKVFLKRHLNYFVKQYRKPVRIARQSTRLGLIKGRMLGALLAKGDVLIFLDSHCECNRGWMEPLLARIAEDRTRVVSPIIDVIDDKTFEYYPVTDELYGAFDWRLRQRWYRAPETELRRRGDDRTLPIKSPIPNGGLFAIDREFFNYFGMYDDALLYFGSENVELGLAAWTCGGSVEIVPCSRVGHVFRSQIPYKIPGRKEVNSLFNSARILETWMDDYRMFFYNLYPDAVRKDRGNTAPRREMRERLGCKSFTWYLENVYPESTFPLYYKFLGQIENTYSKYCLDITHNLITGENDCKLQFCMWDQGGNSMVFTQMFVYTDAEEIASDGLCLDLTSENKVVFERCTNKTSQKWVYHRDARRIKHRESRKCLEFIETKTALASVSKCSHKKKEQSWFMMNNFDWYAPTHKRIR